ncbi:PHD-zinc-finger like domain-containing protein [Mrakia frigida]|uniref:PHD-zinc-finger like domain-containing protein n=1 Tax=Mrakia frigida TaxID=29902 RepID=UPI003FCC09BF
MEKTGSSSSSQPSRKRGREAEASSSRGKSASKAGGGAGGNSSGGDGVASGSKIGASGSVSSSATTSQAIQISSDDFKTLNEKFGREWTTLTRLATSTSTYEDPDVPCAVCDDHLDDEENEIIFCDGGGCNVAVHQECYGVQVVPEGKWFCQKCKLSPRDPVTCVLCRRSIGAFKQTTNQGEWAHVLCASYIPGVSFGDYSKLEPVKGVDKCVKERQKMRCSICHEKGGAPIQCAEKKCCKPFHVSCARDKGLLESMAQEGPTLLPDFERGAMPRVWCEVHRPVSSTTRPKSFSRSNRTRNVVSTLLERSRLRMPRQQRGVWRISARQLFNNSTNLSLRFTPNPPLCIPPPTPSNEQAPNLPSTRTQSEEIHHRRSVSSRPTLIPLTRSSTSRVNWRRVTPELKKLRRRTRGSRLSLLL